MSNFWVQTIPVPSFLHNLHCLYVKRLTNLCEPNFFLSQLTLPFCPRPLCRQTVSLCRQLEAAGASFLTVHGRTPQQRSEPVNLDALRDIVSAVRIPVLANGDIWSMEDARRVQDYTGVKGAWPELMFTEHVSVFLKLSFRHF